MIKLITVALQVLVRVYDYFKSKRIRDAINKPTDVDNNTVPVQKNTATIYLPTGLFEHSKKWTHIVIHHSKSPDSAVRNWEQIKKYHMSYRIDFTIVSKEEYVMRKLEKDGSIFQEPWSDIGYHFGIELIGDHYEIVVGRPLSRKGAHCADMNSKAIGICIIGDFDDEEPNKPQYWMLASLVRHLHKRLEISYDNVKLHRNYASKSCPGDKFSREKLMETIEGKTP